MKYLRLSAMVLTFLFAVSAVFALDPPAKVEREIEFPEVAGWEKGDKTVYPKAELGYSVSYISEEGGTVSFFVYDLGIKDIPSGHDNEVVNKELERVAGELDTAVRMGVVEELEYGEIDTIELGSGFKARRKLASMKMRGIHLTAEVYVFGYDNNFIKIRATRPFEQDGKINKSVKSLFAAVAKSLSGENRNESVAADFCSY